jgi:hypothetical protein
LVADILEIRGRVGFNDCINQEYCFGGYRNGRRWFYADTSEGPLYLWYDAESDIWFINELLDKETFFASCGPAGGKDMVQLWSVWNGEYHISDSRVSAYITRSVALRTALEASAAGGAQMEAQLAPALAALGAHEQ